ncbi:MAG: phage portal protein, partial [Pseudomonadota bacterium]
YLEAIRLDGEGTINGLQVLRPDRMVADLDAGGRVAAWTYRVDHHRRRIGRDGFGWLRVLHLKQFHPSNDVYGLPPLAAARQALDLHNAGADWAKALIDNSAKPSGALIYGKAGDRLTPEQFDRLKQELEAAHTGAQNAGRPLLLEGGLDWKPMGLSPADMDFLEARHAAAREIALAIGVPPLLLGLPGDNTYANYREANTAFWRQTVLPLASRISAALSAWLTDGFGEDVDIHCDLEAVPALASEREALWTRLNDASFLSDDEKRQLAGISQTDGAQ